jgi:hypothetical protein
MPAQDQSAKQPEPKPTVGMKEIAEKLGTDPRTLRVFVRSLDLRAGKGKRYAFASMSDPTVKRIVKEWEKAHAEEQESK